jgi:peroxiredoxin Q/BCP
MTLTEGVPAPDFSLLDDTGTRRSLADFRGKTVVLYFYPKDDTPGCTTEACNFRDDFQKYAAAGVEILGVSPDDPKSHTRFKNKYSLPFTLLADPDHAACIAYGVWGRKKMAGHEYDGVFRSTFVIGPDGTIQKVYKEVKPAEHSAQILSALGQ